MEKPWTLWLQRKWVSISIKEQSYKQYKKVTTAFSGDENPYSRIEGCISPGMKKCDKNQKSPINTTMNE